MSASVKNNFGQHIVYLGLGSNIEPERNVLLAVEALAMHIELLELSSIWISPSVGTDGPDFLNAAVKIVTTYTYAALKSDVLNMIEANLGRVRCNNKFAPRSIDLDILIYDGKVEEQEIWQYAHLAVPLAEIYPNLFNQLIWKSLKQTADTLRKQQNIRRKDLDWNIDFTMKTKSSIK